jgi:hypothetical protein
MLVEEVAPLGVMDQDGPNGHPNFEQKLMVVVVAPLGAMGYDGQTAVALHHGHTNLKQKLVVVAVAPSGMMGQDGPTLMAFPHEPLLMWKQGERKQRATPWPSL